MRRDIPSDRYRYASRCVSRSVSLPCLRRVLKIKFVVDLFPCVSVSWEFGSIAKKYRRGSVRVRRKKSCSISDQFGSESFSPATYSSCSTVSNALNNTRNTRTTKAITSNPIVFPLLQKFEVSLKKHRSIWNSSTSSEIHANRFLHVGLRGK